MTGFDMTLRDYFAAAMLPALPHIGCGCDLNVKEFAEAAYQFADAMLAERERNQEETQHEND